MKDLKVVFFVSRNKDNKNIEGFKERKLPFLTSRTEEELMGKFRTFVQEGLPGELSRFYISVNSRDREKTYRALLHYLIDNPDVKLESLVGRIASLASRSENKESKRFLLDCDVGQDELDVILEYLDNVSNVEIFETYKTPNGFGVITSGFDTRELLKNHPEVELKRDGQKLIYYETKDELSTMKRGDEIEQRI